MNKREIEKLVKEQNFLELTKSRAKAVKKEIKLEKNIKGKEQLDKLSRYLASKDCKRYPKAQKIKKERVAVIDCGDNDKNYDNVERPSEKLVEKERYEDYTMNKTFGDGENEKPSALDNNNNGLDNDLDNDAENTASEDEQEEDDLYKRNTSLIQANEKYCGLRLRLKGAC